MSQTSTDQFGWVGQYIAAEPGAKSPSQYLLVQVLQADGGSVSAQTQQKIKLGSSLRQMMRGYLAPQDWIRVVGKAKVDAKTGQMQWKAREIVKVSESQALTYAQKIRTSSAAKAEKLDQSGTMNQAQSVTRILMCQKSGCRQRGAQRVESAIAQAIDTHGCSQNIKIIPTGCMKQCKTGPHVVVVPSKQEATRRNMRYNSVRPHSAHQIVEKLL